MDNISSQINFKFELLCDISEIDFKEKKDFSNVYNIQGDLKIEIKNTLFFSEGIALLEFYIQLKKWCSDGKDNNFYYNTIEVGEEDNPLIKFILAGDYYYISSPWAKNDLVTSVKAGYLEKSINKFLSEFEESLYDNYRLKTKWSL